MDDENQLSAETIQNAADCFDINAHMVEKYNRLERKIAELKIKFEAHKISRGVKT
ncbi:hypothetical protein H6G33_37500 [Calothrix sp. FACHB-1219]|uniref:hypothetical protein n=1 Tax=unclassified Calothrix TaxID=2619626 RepID=UPI0016879C1C|nr:MULTISPECIES: hypothetical protein [unclassified Calothrix]MBD2208087.1 hypothetical protein [Calothrix sp. FACHB-168]MBD2222625.1 hypothetical protein [Calothrix sp. FACHB-1219]